MATDDNIQDNSQELLLDDVVAIAPDELEDTHKTFLQENAEDLSDEQKETFKDILEAKGGNEDDNKEINPDDIEVEVRNQPKPKNSEESDEDDDVDPEEEKTISKIVDKRLRDSGLGDTKDQIAVDSFIRSKPEMSKYRGVILKHMSTPAYSQVPVHGIAAMVSAGDMQKLGAQKEREAAQRAKETRSPGTPKRSSGQGQDWSRASSADFEAKMAEVKGHRA